MILRPATAADFGFIRNLTTHPDYAPYIGDDDEGQLAAWLADPAVQIVIWQDDRPAGFAIYREIGNGSGRVELFRLALGHIGGGLGRPFLTALTDHGFEALGAARLWLDASGENLRARHLYRSAGFTEEGRLRQHWYRPCLGRNVDLVLYGMLRDEWAARG
jgi:RimJ/RimL family protein N-acetyltransferase